MEGTHITCASEVQGQFEVNVETKICGRVQTGINTPPLLVLVCTMLPAFGRRNISSRHPSTGAARCRAPNARPPDPAYPPPTDCESSAATSCCCRIRSWRCDQSVATVENSPPTEPTSSNLWLSRFCSESSASKLFHRHRPCR